MDIQKIKKIIKVVEEADIHALKVSSDDLTIEITKSAPETRIIESSQNRPVYTDIQMPTSPATPQNSGATGSDNSDQVNQSTNEASGTMIKSPMVGTVYLAPKPEVPNYVSVGSTVSQGDTICLIEAMKLFNEIESDLSGEIKEILVENGQVVEYNQPLFRIA